jgi:hypothetical protein
MSQSVCRLGKPWTASGGDARTVKIFGQSEVVVFEISRSCRMILERMSDCALYGVPVWNPDIKNVASMVFSAVNGPSAPCNGNARAA